MNLKFLRIGHQSHTYKFGNQNWKHFGLWSLTKLWTLPQRNNISSTTNCHYVKMVAHYPTTSAHRLQPQRSNPFLVIILEFGIWTNSYTKFLPSQLPISKSLFAPNPIQQQAFKIHETNLLQNKIIQKITTITSSTKLTIVIMHMDLVTYKIPMQKNVGKF